MVSVKLALVLFVCIGFVCVNSNPISQLFGKSDKTETDDKTTASAVPVPKLAEEATTTTTASPGSACGGLKGFLHMCEKVEPTEPPKNVKARSVPEEDDSDDDDDSDSDDDSDETKEDKNDKDAKDEKKEQEETAGGSPPNSSEPTSAKEGLIEKRQVNEAMSIGQLEKEPVANLMTAQDSNESDESKEEDSKEEDDGEATRRRRDCRDRPGDEYKDCRRKRELVPCVEPKCLKAKSTEAGN